MKRGLGCLRHGLPALSRRWVSSARNAWPVRSAAQRDRCLPALAPGLARHMGLAVGEIFDLDALAADCAADGRYEFMLAATPLPITGACGSSVAAVAIK
jgi:hypothetical protein